MKSPKYKLQIDEIVIELNCGKSTSEEFTSKVKCPDCKKVRHIKNSYIYKQKIQNKFTGCCLSCNAKRRNAQWTKNFHPKYKGPKPTSEGYILIPLKSLIGTVLYELAKQMACKNGSLLAVLEHRLVMAEHLKRPLTKSEIVHHKNGIKNDNNINNLEILTQNTHHKGYGDIYYQKWQETLTELTLLKNGRDITPR